MDRNKEFGFDSLTNVSSVKEIVVISLQQYMTFENCYNDSLLLLFLLLLLTITVILCIKIIA